MDLSATIEELRHRLASEGSLTISIRVHPHAKKTALTDILQDGSLKISVRSAAEDGRANKELLKYLSQLFRVEISMIEVLEGETYGKKAIRISM